jgi:hypothetical protein
MAAPPLLPTKRSSYARRIIDLAPAGERDPERLCEAALNGLPKPLVGITDPTPLPPHATARTAGFVNLIQSGDRPECRPPVPA